MRERSTLDRQLTLYRTLKQDYDDAVDLIELAAEENDANELAAAEDALKDLRGVAEQRAVEALLSGEADANDAYLEIKPGAGGTESQDWAQMLERLYVRWAEDHRFKVEIEEEQAGEEAGIKSATLRVSGTNAYGWLKTESGVHRLVRISPWKMLRARLYEIELQKREAAAQALHAAKTDIGWGHQIRSYVLQPYQMVKDLRTGHQTSDTQSVLDGDIDPFLRASLMSRLKGAPTRVEDIE